MDYYEIGQRIRRCRKAKGLSQEELAEKVGISTPHMSHIENGNTKLSLPVLVDLAVSLEVSTDLLLFGTNENQKSRAIEEIQHILDSCTIQQACILSEIMKNAKMAMDKYS